MIAHLIAALVSLVVIQAPQSQPLVIGETWTMESSTLKETRRINVYLPASA